MHSGHIKLIAGDHPTYDDRDVLSACNHLTIRRMAGWRLCGKRSVNRQFIGLNSSGFLPHTHLLKDWFSRCCEAMIMRLNRDQCRITRLDNSHEVVVTTGVPYISHSGQPDRYMDVEGFFSHKIKSFQQSNATGVPLFSDDGDENKVMMYGGKSIASDDAMDDVWAAIQSKTGLFEEDETAYEKQKPWSPEPGRLIVRVDDFSDEESGVLTEPLLDEAGDTVKKRMKFVDWQNDLGMSAEEITSVTEGSKNDHREVEQTRDVIVRVKT